ncbi:hypothetical protein OEZ86_005188 [Tetradesmus obliquus]|nr:hypothetical protein OEZ86_005188 [Tetradesmus obliquus]
MSRVSRALANLPGQPVLLNDVDEDPAAVIGAPRARVIVRWLVAVALVALLFGLVGWSYATSSELSSGIQVERTYQPTMKNIQDWERDNNTFTCPCTSMRNTVEWAAIIPQNIWQQFDDMTAPQGPVGTPKYNSFCVSHVHLGGSKPGCRLVQHAGLNIPDYGNMNLAPTPRRRGYGYQPARDDFTLRERLVQRYPGSTLQAPACRAIAANLMRLNRTGLQASHLLSQLGLNITVHNAMNDTMYRTAAHVQSSHDAMEPGELLASPASRGQHHGCSSEAAAAVLHSFCVTSLFTTAAAPAAAPAPAAPAPPAAAAAPAPAPAAPAPAPALTEAQGRICPHAHAVLYPPTLHRLTAALSALVLRFKLECKGACAQHEKDSQWLLADSTGKHHQD